MSGLTRRPDVRDVSLQVRAGEVLGIGGLVGAGRTELLRLIYGLDPPDAGEVRMEGRRLPAGRASRAIDAGLGLRPRTASRRASCSTGASRRTSALPDLGRFVRAALINGQAERSAVHELLYNPAMSDSAVQLANLIGRGEGLTELAEPEVPSGIQVPATTVTKENVGDLRDLGYLDFGDERRGWDFVSPGHGDVDLDELLRALNRIGYAGPLSIEWEDSGMDREWGAREALEVVRRTDFAPPEVAFDAAFRKEAG